jgi:valyl-tRNA synthetase
MRGLRAKWIYGTDHAGIGTEVKVVEALASQGSSKEEIGRPAFIERVWEWRAEHGSSITEQYKRLGASLDYEDERFTMDEDYQQAVAKVFVALYEKGLIYRDNYMVNFDPGTGSAVSDLEVIQKRADDTLYMVDYPLESGSGSLTVATVRPETMLADTAIAVNPDDERYSRLVGETALLPLVGRRLKVIADDYVDPEFGTGALKITPGHDPNDFEIGRKHGLEEISVIGEDGRMTGAAPERFRGLTVEEARKAVVAALREEGLISGTHPYSHDVPHSQRSGRRIEPLISLQWFCDMSGLSKPAIEVVKDGRVRFHPAQPWTGVYLGWLEKIQPWCISRQLWWGHQLPVWYRGDETYVGEKPPEGDGWERDPDVLDTWFSSALWPFATLGWPQNPDLRAFYPTDVLVTGRDIIFLWVARMVMMGLEFTESVPFSDVAINSLIQAPDGRRMSKSLGTGIDPLEEIDEHGADALRFGLLAMSSTQDVRYSPQRVKQGRDLANKLWNASRLILMGVDEDAEPSAAAATTLEDRWIVSRLERASRRVTELFDGFRFSPAVLELYDVFWSELCDWYLELAKPRLYGDDPAAKAAVSGVLLHALERSLVLLHPVMPFVTEEVWSHLPGERGLLAVAGWPEPDGSLLDEQAEAALDQVIEVVTDLRRFRDDVGAKPSIPVPARFAGETNGELLEQIGRMARFSFGDEDGEVFATIPVAGGSLEVLRSDAFDPAAAEQRLATRREELSGEIERGEKKLANERFVERAPEEVVAEERRKLEDYRRALERLGQ